MKCSLIPQFLILMALGLGAGFVHAKLAPVKTAIDKPADPADALKGAKPKRPMNAHPVPPETSDTTKTPPAENPAENPAEKPAEKPAETPANPSRGADKPIAPPPQPPVAPAETPKTPAAEGEEVISQAMRDKGHITLKEAYTFFTSNTAYFVDTRKKAEYEEGHIKDAFGIPLAAFHGKTPKLIDAIDRSAPVVIYCLGGNCDESEEVAKNFNLMGYKNVYIIHEGFPGWKKAGYPIQTGPGIQEEE